MIKRIICTLILSAILGGIAFAHSGKPDHHVIIDTDGAIDDMRAISMLLSANDIRVLALTCSQGTLVPEEVFVKVNSLLSAFHHEGIPVGISEGINSELPAWSTFALDIQWANETNIQSLNQKRESIELLKSTIADYQNKVTLIALGSLKTYADWLKADPKVAKKIERIIWYNNHNIQEGFNYGVSPESFNYIKQSGISLDVVHSNTGELIVNQDYLNLIHGTNSIYASQIEDVHSQELVVEKINDKHLYLWDDIIPLYLTVPILFKIEAKQNLNFVSISQPIPPDFINEIIGKLLISANSTNNRVFKAFPIDTTLYKMDYAKILNRTIEKFGLIEWKAISMTNEIHGHTGIYSIIGAKMGIRAMEYFNVGINNLQVTSFAGTKPPLSCFNDGIQISTGATIGQGLITISDSVSVIPSAIFEFNNQQVTIAVKPEIAERMQNDIDYGVTTYGLLTDRYWLYIEELAIRYWVEYDRQEIFVIKKM